MMRMLALQLVTLLHCACGGGWQQLASAVTWTVGDSQGWTIGPDYSTWAAGKNFSVGDVLFFPYTAGAHDVVEVDKAGYDACSDASAIGAVHSEGNANITLNSTGTFYYLCSFPGHCTAGMELAVTVSNSSTAGGTPPANATTPTPAPASTPSAPPPANATTPTPAPASTPSAPPPANATTSTPAPASTASAPPPSVSSVPPPSTNFAPPRPVAQIPVASSLASSTIVFLLSAGAALLAI